MNFQNVDSYQVFKCSSLTCDTGGTVYEASKRYDSVYYQPRYADYQQSAIQNQAGKLEKIVYLVDAQNNNVKGTGSLVDPTTHLDDDRFNDHNSSNLVNKVNIEVIPDPLVERDFQQYCYSNIQETGQNEDFEYVVQHSNVRKDANQNFDDNRTIIIESSDQNDDSSENELEIDEGSSHDDLSVGTDALVYNYYNLNYQNSLCSSKNHCNFNTYHSNVQEETRCLYQPSQKVDIDTDTRHSRSRKQKYKIKNDTFSELIIDNRSSLSTKANDGKKKAKKRKAMYNGNKNENEEFYQEKDPFENVKMSSILKDNIKQNLESSKYYYDEAREPQYCTNNEYSFLSQGSSATDQVFIRKEQVYQINSSQNSFSSTSTLKKIHLEVELNSEFTSADYFDYVQPRERIVESNMDKLVSPTVEFDLAELMKLYSKEQVRVNQLKEVDHNGNIVELKPVQPEKTVLSPSEIAEKKFFARTEYAKKLGFENLFNTCNDSLIDDILYDPKHSYKRIKLDINLVHSNVKTLTHNNFLGNALKSYSCSILESLKEINRFGGFPEETTSQAEEVSNILFINTKPVKYNKAINYPKIAANINFARKTREQSVKQTHPNIVPNVINKPYLPTTDCQPKYNAVEHCTSKNNSTKKASASLKIKIKKISNQNDGYAVCGQTQQIKKEIGDVDVQTVKIDLERYECHDCGEKFRTKRVLKTHISEYHRGPYDMECDICHMQFKKSSAHKRHKPWCERNKSYLCHICKKVYLYKTALEKHVRAHDTKTRKVSSKRSG